VYILKRMGTGIRYLFIPVLIVFMISVILNPMVVSEGIKNGISVCYNTLIPSLFLFVFLSKLLYAIIRSTPLGSLQIVKTVMLIVFGFIGGFPVGASMLGEMVKNREITESSASGWLCGLVNPGPGFVIAAVGAGMLGSSMLGTMIYAALCVASAVCLFIFAKGKINSGNIKSSHVNLSEVIASSVSSMIGLCGCVIIFSGILNLVLAEINSDFAGMIISMVLEVASGVSCSAKLGGSYSSYYAAAAISICGLSTIAQVSQILSDSGVSMRTFLFSRLVHLPLTLLVLQMEMKLLPVVSAEAFAIVNKSAELFCLSPEFSFFAFMAAAVLLFGEKSLKLFTDRKKMV